MPGTTGRYWQMKLGKEWKTLAARWNVRDAMVMALE